MHTNNSTFENVIGPKFTPFTLIDFITISFDEKGWNYEMEIVRSKARRLVNPGS